MIFENEVLIPEAQMSQLRKETLEAFPQFEKQKFVILKYHRDLVKPSRDNPGKNDQPESLIIRCVQNVTGPQGAKQYRYAVSTVVREKGVMAYEPQVIKVDKQIIIDDIDMLVFFHHFCPKVKGCINARKKDIPLLVIEDQRQEAIEITEKRRNEALYLDLLYNKLSQRQLTLVAHAYNITTSDDVDEEILRERIDALVKTTVGGVGDFLSRTNFQDAEQVEQISGITRVKEAIDLEIIRFNQDKKRWELFAADGSFLKILLKSQRAHTPNLYNYLVKTEPTILKAIQKEVAARLEEA
jgi:hypothetical protein